MERSLFTSKRCSTICQGSAYAAAKRQCPGTLCHGRAFARRLCCTHICPRVCLGSCRGCVDRFHESQTSDPISVELNSSAVLFASCVSAFWNRALACKAAGH